ncbi:hypothetical protein ACHAQA_006440 [Verticillium albo-atrum]
MPPPPEPETIELVRLPLPPAISDYSPGACSEAVNPRKTGRMPVTNGRGFMSGDFLPDGHHVLALIPFVGAPPAPEPGSTYNGSHIVVVKTDDSVFANGERWKCLTCGVPGVPNKAAVNETEHLDYPQAFDDGRRALVGTYIIDCGEHELAAEDCTTENIRLLPLRWNTAANDSGPGGSMRELRLHPDNVHLGFSSFTTSGAKLGQLGFYGRLEYNASPQKGLPLAPRYDVVNVSVLIDQSSAGPIETAGDKITINHQAISVGELRAFSGPGDEVVYVGYPTESSNLDMYAVSMDTGAVRRLTSHPEYVDPIDSSPNGKWWAIADTRGTDRQMFLAGMRGIPPLTDLVSSSVTSATRNNGQRRFFTPWVLDAAGDRGTYYGQKINGPGFGELGSGALNDPQWNCQADPKWSFDSTKIVYWEAQTVSPACGGNNPLPCFLSEEDGGRDVRMIMATFPNREPSTVPQVSPRPDFIPWATPYVPAAALPDRPSPEAGTFKLEAKTSGSAQVFIEKTIDALSVRSVAVTYHNYSEDGLYFLNGYENVTAHLGERPTVSVIDWFSNLTQRGPDVLNTKLTSDDGFHISIDVLVNIFDAEGTISTTVDGMTYKQPLNGA